MQIIGNLLRHRMMLTSAVNCSYRLLRSRVQKVNKIKREINELLEVPLKLSPRCISCLDSEHKRTTRLVHSVAVSLEQSVRPFSFSRIITTTNSSCGGRGRRGAQHYSNSRRASYCTSSIIFEDNINKMPSEDLKKPFERLPVAVRPRHYILSLTPDLKKLDFKGDVQAEFEVRSYFIFFLIYVHMSPMTSNNQYHPFRGAPIGRFEVRSQQYNDKGF